MRKLLANQKWLLVCWLGLAAVILGVDFFNGQEIVTTYFFLIPVVLAARFNGRWLGVTFAIVLPLCRFCFHFFWKDSRDLLDMIFNVLIRVAVLVWAAILIDRVTRQAQEIRVLRGFLPICSFCKKIRTADQKWKPMESYITEHSEARFTHSLCPECAKKHYREFLAGQPGDSEAPPK